MPASSAQRKSMQSGGLSNDKKMEASSARRRCWQRSLLHPCSASRRHRADPVKIGASLPITGGLAINGQKHKDGYELCIDLINQAGGLLGEPGRDR